jgi:hypothetical protein
MEIELVVFNLNRHQVWETARACDASKHFKLVLLCQILNHSLLQAF